MGREARIWFGANRRAAARWLQFAGYGAGERVGDRAGWLRQSRSFAAGYATLLEPYWPAVRAGHHAERARHARVSPGTAPATCSQPVKRLLAGPDQTLTRGPALVSPAVTGAGEPGVGAGAGRGPG